VGSIRRLSCMAGNNRKLKRELLNVWKGIQVWADTSEMDLISELGILALPSQILWQCGSDKVRAHSLTLLINAS